MAISQLKRPADGVHAFWAVWDLSHAKAQQGHLMSVREDAGAPVGRDGAECHICRSFGLLLLVSWPLARRSYTQWPGWRCCG